MLTPHCFPILIVTIVSFRHVSGQTAEQELTFSPADEAEFHKFRDVAQSLIPSTMNPIFKEDLALAKIFRNGSPANSPFSFLGAVTLLKEIIAFREQAGIDRYNKTAMGLLPLEFPYTINKTRDLLGSPILFFQGGRWRYYKALAEGKRDLLLAHMYNVYEQGYIAGLKSPSGRYFFLIDSINMDLMNVKYEVGPWMREVNSNIDIKWPRGMARYVFINVPSFFTLVCDVIKTLLRPETQENFKAYGTDSSQWHPYLLQYISPDQIPEKIEIPKPVATAPAGASIIPFFG